MDEELPNSIDDLFKKAIDEHEEAVPASIWKNIDSNLDKKKVIFLSRKYNKLKWIAAALLLFSAAMAMYTWNTKIKNRNLAEENLAHRTRSATENSSSKRNKPLMQNDSSKYIGKIKTLNENAVEKKISEDQRLSPGSTVKREMSVKKDDLLREVKEKDDSRERSKKNTMNKLAGNAPGIDKSQKESKFRTIKSVSEDLINNDDGQVMPDQFSAKEPDATIGSQSTNQTKKKNPLLYTLLFPAETIAENSLPVHLSEAQLAALPAMNAISKAGTPKPLNAGESPKFNSHNTTAKQIKSPLLAATLFYSPDFVSAEVENGHKRFREDDRNEIKSKESIKNTSSFGIGIDYYIGHRLVIGSGITLSSITTEILPKTLYARPDDNGNINYRFNCSAGYSFVDLDQSNPPASGDSISALSSTNILKYITVPVTIKYILGKGKFTLTPGIGFGINFLSKGNIETAIASNGSEKQVNIDHIEGLNKIYLSSLISLSANYDLSKTWSVTLAPIARFALSPINKDASVKTNLNSFGLQAGLTFKLW